MPKGENLLVWIARVDDAGNMEPSGMSPHADSEEASLSYGYWLTESSKWPNSHISFGEGDKHYLLSTKVPASTAAPAVERRPGVHMIEP